MRPTTAEDLLYHFDHVAYFHAAHDPARRGAALDRSAYVRKGPLWQALVADGPAIVLIDEIDKARRLPEPFLRRCVFHHIEFDEGLLRRAVAARRDALPGLGGDLEEAAIGRLMELRGRELRKKPATAEFLVWLAALLAQGASAGALRDAPLAELPALSALVKDRDDWQQL